MACYGGERGWPAVVERGGGLLWWREGVACCGGERGWPAVGLKLIMVSACIGVFVSE